MKYFIAGASIFFTKKDLLSTLLFSSLIPFLFLMSACGVAQVTPPLIIDEPKAMLPLPPAEYRMQVGDELHVKFYYNNELNEQVTVRPDGRISLQLVGQLMAAGFTPSELTAALKQRYSTELANPEVTIIVRKFEAQKIFVDGEVQKPGIIPINGTMTVMQSIASAGGMKQTGRMQDILLIRKAGNKPIVLPVNLRKALNGEAGHDIFLQSYDIVYVPKTPIASINQWVREYIRNILPVNVTFNYDIANF